MKHALFNFYAHTVAAFEKEQWQVEEPIHA